MPIQTIALDELIKSGLSLYFATSKVLLKPLAICETKHGKGKVLDFHKNYEENGGRRSKSKRKKEGKKGLSFL